MAADAHAGPAWASRAHQRIRSKPFLERYYQELYRRAADFVATCACEGDVLELGSGGGFLKEVIPDVITSDLYAAPGIDRVVDATALPFADGSLKAIVLVHAFHHIPDVRRFLHEAARCVAPGGGVFLIEPYPGTFADPVNRYLHHEGYDREVREWAFPASGSGADANQALAWNVFFRDRAQYEREFPSLAIERTEPHSPLRYILSGGLKWWRLVPHRAFDRMTAFDAALVRRNREHASFVDIALRRMPS